MSASRTDLVHSGLACWWCGRTLAGSRSQSPRAKTREHIVPKSRGGSAKAGNIRAACRQCNTSRGDSMQWIPWIKHGGHRIAGMTERQWSVLLKIPDRFVQGQGRAVRMEATP